MQKRIRCIMLLIVSLLILTGCNDNNEQSKLKEKTYAEVKYLEQNIDSLLQQLIVRDYNNDTSHKSEINWDTFDDKIEKIYLTWGTLAIDLNKLGCNSEEILAFGDEINNEKLSINVKQEDMIIKSLVNLYSYIPKYIAICHNSGYDIVKKNIKYKLIASASRAYFNEWDEVTKTIEEAEVEYLKLMENIDYVNNNQHNANKIYVLLEELKKTIEMKNYEIFIFKYKVLINEF